MEISTPQNIKKDIDEIHSNVLFVADLPNGTTSEDLQKMFKDYQFHYVSLNNYKTNQIWAQVYLENKDCADRARHDLNGYILKPMNGANSMKEGKPVRICKYEAKGKNRQTNIKQSLLVKNIDALMSQKEFYQKFLEFGDIVSAKIEYDSNGVSKGFGYIYYYDEESAEKAKKDMNGKLFYGKPLEIVNLIPGKKTKSNAITLFVLNIPNTITDKELSTIFEQFGPVSNISVNQKGFAYVSYNNFDSATKCLREMKLNPISFPGMPNIVVKYASSKEERESNKNFNQNNNEGYFYGKNNLNIQFNCLYYNDEIKTDLDLEKEIKLFIKVVMLMDFTPKEVLVDLESMSGLVQFERPQDYGLFFKKYREYCSTHNTLFECIPYTNPIPTEENQNYIENKDMFNNNNNNNPMLFGPRNMGPTPGQFNMQRPYNYSNMNNNFENRRNNNIPNFQNPPQLMNNNPPYQPMPLYGNNSSNKNEKFFNGNNNNNINNNNFQNFQRNRNFINNSNNYNNRQRQNYNYNYNNNQQNNNKRFNQRNNFGNNNNNNNNFNNNNKTKYIFRPGDNININNMKMNMMGMYPMNPFIQKPMMTIPPRNRPQYKNYQNTNLGNMDLNNNELDDINQKNDIDIIDQRNLQSLNPSQLLSQFNQPPINVYADMLDSKEQEEIRMEIADSIYEIVYAKYPYEASKITGMIQEKGIEKMNMLLSKKEDLDEIIEKAYELIMKNKKENESKVKNKKNSG